MPLYFFSVSHGQKPTLPRPGLEFPDDEAAWEEATTACGEMIRDLDGDLKAGPEWRMEVTNETGDVIYRLRFSAEAYDKRIQKP
jgi:hypothetical protein